MSSARGGDDVELFGRFRRRLLGVAYRMTGSIADAEDVVQDTYERWLRTDTSTVANPEAYLTTMTTRRAIDRLDSAQKRREVYVGPWLPEPVLTPDPAEVVELDQSVTIGYLHLLEQLSPIQRAVHLLHEVFDLSYGEIAPMVGRTESSCRQIASRARSRLRAATDPDDGDDRAGGGTARRPIGARTAVPAADRASPEREAEHVDAFLAALAAGDVDGVAALLTADVVHLSDGGADRRAARNPVVGPDRVARLLTNLGRRLVTEAGPGLAVDICRVNGEPAMVASVDGTPVLVIVLGVVDEGICAVNAVLNPDKLRAVAAGDLVDLGP